MALVRSGCGEEAVPTLTQMLMGQDAKARRVLIDLLARVPGYQGKRVPGQAGGVRRGRGQP